MACETRPVADIEGAIRTLGSVMPREAVEAIIALVEDASRQIASNIADETEARERAARAGMQDQRRHNVRRLLDHYHLLQQHREEAVYDVATIERAREVTPEELFDIMTRAMPRYDARIEGVEKAASRTHLLMCHLDLALNAYREYCESSPNAAQQRRWRVIEARYLQNPRKTTNQIAQEEHLVKRVIERDLQAGVNDLAVKLFGVDALDDFAE